MAASDDIVVAKPDVDKVFTDAELDLMAYDIADMLERFYPNLYVSQDDIRPHLPDFLAKITEGS
jgi:hypothetical protein